jgi:hypothetical protein
VFWVAGYGVAFFREFMYQNVYVYPPTYVHTGKGLHLLNVPATIPMGWLFEAYISLHLAQAILRTDLSDVASEAPKISAQDYGERVLPVIGLACAITGTIAVAIEAAGMSMGWWSRPNGQGFDTPGWRAGADFVDGHIYTVQWILLLMVYLLYPPLRVKRILINVAAAVLAEVVVLGLDPPLHHTRWGPLIVGLAAIVCISLVVALLSWKHLRIFLVIWLLEQNNSFPLDKVAHFFGQTHDNAQLDASMWSASMALLYCLYLIRRQRVEAIRTSNIARDAPVYEPRMGAEAPGGFQTSAQP